MNQPFPSVSDTIAVQWELTTGTVWWRAEVINIDNVYHKNHLNLGRGQLLYDSYGEYEQEYSNVIFTFSSTLSSRLVSVVRGTHTEHSCSWVFYSELEQILKQSVFSNETGSNAPSVLHSTSDDRAHRPVESEYDNTDHPKPRTSAQHSRRHVQLHPQSGTSAHQSRRHASSTTNYVGQLSHAHKTIDKPTTRRRLSNHLTSSSGVQRGGQTDSVLKSKRHVRASGDST